MKDTPRLPLLVLLPGLDGTGKLFADFVRALGAGVESRVVAACSAVRVAASNPYPWLAWAGPFAFLLPIKSLPRWARVLVMWGSKNAGGAPGNAQRAVAGVAGRVLRRRIAALLAVDAVESLDRIAVPALIMFGRHDRVVPYAATEPLIAHIPGAKVADIDGPHLLLQACPEECAAAVLKFMTGPLLRVA